MFFYFLSLPGLRSYFFLFGFHIVNNATSHFSQIFYAQKTGVGVSKHSALLVPFPLRIRVCLPFFPA